MSEVILEKNNVTLPTGWVRTKLDSCVQILDGRRIPVSSEKRKGMKGKYPYYGASGIIDYVNKPIFKGKYLLIGEDGANLLSRSTPIAFIAEGEFWVNNHAHVLTTYGGIPLEFLSFYINSIDLSSWVSGTAQPKLNQANMNKIPIVLAPLNEQKRIVLKIEELFSKLDTILNDIKKIRLQLIQYKKSLLQDVFSGRFTSEWRKNNRPDISGHSLIELSLQQRRKLYANLTKNSKSGARYYEPTTPNLVELPGIPESWSWASFEQISERVTVGYVGTMKKEYVKSGIPFLRSQNVRENKFDPEGLKFINSHFHTKLSKSKLVHRDIVVVRSGSVGVSCVIPENLLDANCSDLLIIKNPLVINPYFGSYYLNSIKDSRVQREKVGITLTHFNTESLAKLAIPIPPREEQEIIVKELRRKFSFMDELGKVQEETIKDLSNLEKIILRSAFVGKLVPQDSNDEPAEILLQKIKQEKEKLEEKQTIIKTKPFNSKRVKNAR